MTWHHKNNLSHLVDEDGRILFTVRGNDEEGWSISDLRGFDPMQDTAEYLRYFGRYISRRAACHSIERLMLPKEPTRTFTEA